MTHGESAETQCFAHARRMPIGSASCCELRLVDQAIVMECAHHITLFRLQSWLGSRRWTDIFPAWKKAREGRS